MKTLLKYFKGYKKECVLGPLFKLLEASFELIVPLVVANIIDKGIGNNDKEYIVKMSIVMLALGIVGLVCSLTAQYYSAKAAVGFAAKVRNALFKHIQSLSYTEIDSVGTSTLITRMVNDVNQLQNGVNMTLRLLLRSPFIVFGAMIMAFTIDTKAAIIFIFVIVALSVVICLITVITIPMQRKVQGKLDKVLGLTRDNLKGSRVIRAFALEENEQTNFKNANEDYVGYQLLTGRISALLNPVTFAIINVGLVVLIYKGAVRVDMGNLTQGQVVALANYMSQILVELLKFANFVGLDIKALASASRVESIFLLESSMVEGNNKEWPQTSEYSVEYKGVNLRYSKSKEDSLTNVSFAARKGDVIGIIGGTGSGKTSLVNLIPRFYDVSEGSVLVNGVDVREYSYEELRSHIGIVPQKAVLVSGTIRENLKWGNEAATEEELIKALKIAQAYDIVQAKADGMDEMITEGGKNLSGGQKQRLTIARALVKNPDILILDDSASALDYVTDAALRTSLKEMDNPPTTFIVSQRTSSIMHADNIIVLDDGLVAGQGTHNELLESCEVYREIYDSQFKVE